MNHENEIVLVYDQRCPVCESYSQMVRIRKSVGELTLLNARDGGELVDQISARGWDIDQGMVLKLDQQLFYGADAIQALALISSRSSVFNRLNYWIFKTPSIAKLLYPVLATCRNILLKLLGRAKINNLGLSDNDRF